jgi:hypothetical protein
MIEQRFCPFCGTPTVPGAAFCVKCGRAVAAAAPAAAVAPAAPPPPAAAAQPPAAAAQPATGYPPPAAAAAPPAVTPPAAPPPATAYPAPQPPAAAHQAPSPLPSAYPGTPPPSAYPAGPPPSAYPMPPGASVGPGMVYAPPPSSANRPMSAFSGGRSTGVMVLSLLAAVGGVIGLWAGFQYIQFADNVEAYGWSGDAARTAGIIIVVVSLAWLGVAWGLWSIRPWAWLGAAVVATISLVLQVLALLNGGSAGDALLQIAINAAILYYLSTPAVRAVFRRPSGLGPPGR